MKKIVLILFCIVFTMPCFAENTLQNFFNRNPVDVISDSQGVYVVKIDTSKLKKSVKPYVSDSLITTRDLFEKEKFELVVNAGFFDAKNQKTVSYVTIDGKLVANPKDNENLTGNKFLEQYLDKIYNRAEFRVYDFQGHDVYDIAYHNDAIPVNCVLKHSIQAGPMLTPKLSLAEEFFILTDENGNILSESASALHRYARTAIGILENNIYIFIATDQNRKTIAEMADLAKKYKMEKAMAFDGGGSTSFDYKDYHIISEKDNQGRKVKSFLIIP